MNLDLFALAAFLGILVLPFVVYLVCRLGFVGKESHYRGSYVDDSR